MGPTRPVGSTRCCSRSAGPCSWSGTRSTGWAANYAAHHRKGVQMLTLLEPVLVSEDLVRRCARSLCQHHCRSSSELVAAPPVHDQLGGMIRVWAPPTHQIGDDPTAGGPVGDPYPAKLGPTASTRFASQRIQSAVPPSRDSVRRLSVELISRMTPA